MNQSIRLKHLVFFFGIQIAIIAIFGFVFQRRLSKKDLDFYDKIKASQIVVEDQVNSIQELTRQFGKLDSFIHLQGIQLELQEETNQLMVQQHEENKTRNKEKLKELSVTIVRTQARIDRLQEQARQFSLINKQ